jgi:copper chaperone CopZ
MGIKIENLFFHKKNCDKMIIDIELSDINNETVFVSISGMTCGSCSSSIESTVGNLNGVNKINVNLVMAKAIIEFNPKLTGIRNNH